MSSGEGGTKGAEWGRVVLELAQGGVGKGHPAEGENMKGEEGGGGGQDEHELLL